MAESTDPALELAELCDRLNVNTKERGDTFLAQCFEVDPWSAEFFQIAYSIVNRTVALEAILRSINTSPLVLNGAAAHLSQVREAFSLGPLSSPWSSGGMQRIGQAHSSPIRMLSMGIPTQYQYPKLAPEEAVELQQLVDQLLEWLRTTQLSDKDFIRESLIEGLEQFLFRLQHLEWFGWGYSIQSLRDVIAAYLALERDLNPQANPDAAAVLQKVGAALKKVFSYASTAKEAAETGDWVLVCLRAAVATGGPAIGYVAGLLTHS